MLMAPHLCCYSQLQSSDSSCSWEFDSANALAASAWSSQRSLYAWSLCMYQRCVIVKIVEHGIYTQNTGVLSTGYTRKAQSERNTAYHMTWKHRHHCGYNINFSICSIRWLSALPVSSSLPCCLCCRWATMKRCAWLSSRCRGRCRGHPSLP